MTRKIRKMLADSPVAPELAARSGDFALESNHSRRRIVRGNADMTGCEEIRALSVKCARALGSGGAALIIDLTGVEHADTKLMACLVSVLQLARSTSVEVELRSSRCVNDLAEFCRLTWLIERNASVEGV